MRKLGPFSALVGLAYWLMFGEGSDSGGSDSGGSDGSDSGGSDGSDSGGSDGSNSGGDREVSGSSESGSAFSDSIAHTPSQSAGAGTIPPPNQPGATENLPPDALAGFPPPPEPPQEG